MAAFGTGVIIGGAIAQPPRYTRPAPVYGSRHVQWCYDRYRSYRAYDNTYQPYGGPRRQCYSPYG
ncbi:Lectin-like protein BA14k precursor [compost metagenome]